MRSLLTYLLTVLFLNGFYSQSVQLLPDTTKICEGDSVLLNIGNSYDNFSSVYWRTPAGIITNTNLLNVKKGGRYSVRVFSAYYSKLISDSTELVFLPKPKSILKDTFICGNDPVKLNAGNENCYYLWSTGETAQRITARKPGVYWVKISNGKCSVSDSFRIKQVRMNKNLLPEEIGFCAGENQKVISIKTEPGTKIVWNTGAVTASINASREGIYWVRTSLSPCGQSMDSVKVFFKDCECQMLIPNSFTPNEDNRNDYFFLVSECEYTFFSMNISDRWGNSIFTSYQINAKWDGRFKGNLCPEDIYIYKIESQEKGSDKKQLRTGHVSLFR